MKLAKGSVQKCTRKWEHVFSGRHLACEPHTHTHTRKQNEHMRLLTWRLGCCCGRHCCGRCGCRLCDADAVHKFRCFHLVNKNYRIVEVGALATSSAVLLALSPMVALTICIPVAVAVANTVTVHIAVSVSVSVAVSIALHIVVFIDATVIIVISAVSACIVSAVQRHRIGRIEIIVFHRCWL